MLDITIEQIISLGRLNFFLITVVYFVFLYFAFTLPAYYFFTKGKRYQLFQKKDFRPNQIKTEIQRSMVSILMFGVLAFPMFEGLRLGILNIKFEFTWLTFIWESVALFLWNELHFYVIHRTFHFKMFYKYHVDHHYSNVPSPFSAYSFHWSEGILLGAVMPIIMLVHDFQFYSLMTLPVMSIMMNVLGHSNVDFNPDQSMNNLMSFSKRHSQHHKIPHSNYGFFLPYFDIIFKTDGDGTGNHGKNNKA